MSDKEREFMSVSNLNALTILLNDAIAFNNLDIPYFSAHENQLVTNTTDRRNNPHVFFWDYNARTNKIECRFSLGDKYNKDVWDHKISFSCGFSIEKRLDLICNDILKKVIIPGYNYYVNTILPRHNERISQTRKRMDKLNRFNKMLKGNREVTEDTDRLSEHSQTSKIYISQLYVGTTNNLDIRGITDEQTEHILKYLGFEEVANETS